MEWGWLILGIIVLALGAGLKKLTPPIRSQDNSGLKKYLPYEDNDMGGTSWDGAIANIARADTSLRALMQADSGLVEKIQSTLDYYDPRAGVFTNWFRRLKGENRNRLLEVLTQEQQLLIKQAATFEQEVREGKKQQVEYHLFVARNVSELAGLKAQAQLNSQAFGSGMTLDHFSASNYEKELAKIRQQEEEARAERERKEEEARIARNLQAAKQYKRNEDEITNDLRTELENALISLDQTKSRTDISAKTKSEIMSAKQNQINNLKFRIAAREKKAQADEESYL